MSQLVKGWLLTGAASLSCAITAYAAVPGGAPVQVSGGDWFAPSQVKSAGSALPSLNAGLCKANGPAKPPCVGATTPGEADGDATAIAMGSVGVGPLGVGLAVGGSGDGSAGAGPALHPA